MAITHIEKASKGIGLCSKSLLLHWGAVLGWGRGGFALRFGGFGLSKHRGNHKSMQWKLQITRNSQTGSLELPGTFSIDISSNSWCLQAELGAAALPSAGLSSGTLPCPHLSRAGQVTPNRWQGRLWHLFSCPQHGQSQCRSCCSPLGSQPWASNAAWQGDITKMHPEVHPLPHLLKALLHQLPETVLLLLHRKANTTV